MYVTIYTFSAGLSSTFVFFVLNSAPPTAIARLPQCYSVAFGLTKVTPMIRWEKIKLFDFELL